ncbi:phosphoglycerate mutase [Streptomyces olivochromogenes]|uniref:Phosphoglycerate mutase n=1 Tax=Streptomyces olivochromogenes TaxID=1963 RepID=A0A250V803_STROL|nr:phosphoglycerate mutase [Streptomyces olivochromogenes]
MTAAGAEAGAEAARTSATGDAQVQRQPTVAGVEAGEKPGRGRRVILWRHGQTSWNVDRRFQGTTDVELTETGIGQARRAARLLASLKPDVIVASDLQRAANTAAELSTLTGIDVIHDEGLRETYAGVWQGLTHEEIIAQYGDEYAAWKRGEPVRRGGGELETEVADRAAPVVLRHADKLPEDGTLVVVSHGGTIRTTIGRLLGLESRHWESLGGLSNCCWSVLGEGARGWRLLEHNAGTLPEPVLGDDD